MNKESIKRIFLRFSVALLLFILTTTLVLAQNYGGGSGGADKVNVKCELSAETVRVGEDITFTADTGSESLNNKHSYEWYGDISSTDRVTTQTFSETGKYYVSVRARKTAVSGASDTHNCNIVKVLEADATLEELLETEGEEEDGSVSDGPFIFKNDLGIDQDNPVEDVRELQRRLRIDGFFNYPTDTDIFGPVTFEAVLAYQRFHTEIGAVTGFVGPNTRLSLNLRLLPKLSDLPATVLDPADADVLLFIQIFIEIILSILGE